jgi:hypothetical protein
MASDRRREMAANPKAGDWWHDHYSPVCLVVGVSNKEVVITQKYEAGPRDGQWKWPDEIMSDDLISMSREEFVWTLQYDTMPEKLWASVVRPSKVKDG